MRPLLSLSLHITSTYKSLHPSYSYSLTINPKRLLTNPSSLCLYDPTIHVDDTLGHYTILDLLGTGTFSHVFKCIHTTTHTLCAIKVIKSKQSYLNQSLQELSFLSTLSSHPHVISLLDSFMHGRHLCIVTELLSMNLYELLKQNSFKGVSPCLVWVFAVQLIDVLVGMQQCGIIHCDLKPENVLLVCLDKPRIKVIDFGSSCFVDKQHSYYYIQSRFYRAPEVLLQLPSYTCAIDVWSVGCILAELYFGLPLFPGHSEYNQLCRIVDVVGPLPRYMVELGRQSGLYFGKDEKLKGLKEYGEGVGREEVEGKVYFERGSLEEMIRRKSGGRECDAFVDLLKGMLCVDPVKRMSVQEARNHPFVTGDFGKSGVGGNVRVGMKKAGSTTTVGSVGGGGWVKGHHSVTAQYNGSAGGVARVGREERLVESGAGRRMSMGHFGGEGTRRGKSQRSNSNMRVESSLESVKKNKE